MDSSSQARVIGGRYECTELIGRGGMGEVWRARDTLLQRDVAVKRLTYSDGNGDETTIARSMREARLAARLNHPHAVSIYDVVMDEGLPCLVMELVEGTSLKDHIASKGRLDPTESAKIGRQVASALAAAHKRGIIHRDVKPANVLIDTDGEAKLTDFGIARDELDAGLTGTGTFIGTPSFLAPEIVLGENHGAAGDVWALGAVLWNAVEGDSPFASAGNAMAVMSRIASTEAPVPAHGGNLTPTIMSMMRRDPVGRPDATAVIGELDRVLTGPVHPLQPGSYAPQHTAPPGPAAPPAPPGHPGPQNPYTGQYTAPSMPPRTTYTGQQTTYTGQPPYASQSGPLPPTYTPPPHPHQPQGGQSTAARGQYTAPQYTPPPVTAAAQGFTGSYTPPPNVAPQAPAAQGPRTPDPNRRRAIVAVAAIVAVGLVALVAILIVRGGTSNQADPGTPSGSSASNSGGSNPGGSSASSNPASDCQSTGTDGFGPAAGYILAIELGDAANAQACVKPGTVPESTATSLLGKTFIPQLTDETGGGDHGATARYKFTSATGSGGVEITTTKGADGTYQVTQVTVTS